MQDYFTKWPKAIPLKDVYSATTLPVLLFALPSQPLLGLSLGPNIESEQQDQAESTLHQSRTGEAGNQYLHPPLHFHYML